MKVYMLYIDCELQGVFKYKKSAQSLLNEQKLLKKERKEKFFKEDNWIDTHEVIR